MTSVKTGFNTKYAEFQFNVIVDEADLARILADAGIPPDAQLTATEAFQLLDTVADRFCAAKHVSVPGEDRTAEDWKVEVKRLTGQLNAKLDKIKARLGIE